MKRLAVLILCAQASVAAEDDVRKDTIYQLSPIIVTATQARGPETPVTFSNLGPADLRDRYTVRDVPVMLSDLPSITSYSENGNGIGYSYINLRGFTQRRISVMINGVPQNDPEDHGVYWIDLPDLLSSSDIVHVQRGAGSAFYGPPAIGGSINIVTNPYAREPSVLLETMLGFQEYGDSSTSLSLATRKIGLSVSSGLINGQYMLYGRLGRIQSEGYRTNASVDFQSYFLGAVRFDGNMTTRLHVFGGPIEDGLAYKGLPKFVNRDRKARRQNYSDWGSDPAGSRYSYVVPRRPQEIENFSQPHYELIHEWRVAPSVILHTTLFYYSGEGFFDYDASWADTSMLRLGYLYGIPTSANPGNTLVRATVHNDQWGWLPRVEMDHGNGSLVIGAELRMHRSTHWGTIRYAESLPAGFDPDYHFYHYSGERDIFSFYGQEILRAQDDLLLMGSLQVVYNRYGISGEKYLGYTFSVPYAFLNPRLGVTYGFSEQWRGYLSLAYTSREPTMRNLYAAEDSYFGATPQFGADTTGGRVRYRFDEPLAQPEHLFNAELGARYHGECAELSANVFWMEFTDELVKSGRVDIFGQPVTGNAERTRHLGIEIEGAVSPHPSVTFSGNVTISRNYHVRYSGLENGQRVSYDGNPIAGFPDVMGNARLTLSVGGLKAALSGKFVGAFYTDNSKRLDCRNDAYEVFNAELLYRLPSVASVDVTLRCEVRNIFNKLYFMSGEGSEFFPAAERNYLLGCAISL